MNYDTEIPKYSDFDSIQDIEERILKIHLFSWKHRFVFPNEVMEISRQAYELSKTIKFELGEALSLSNIGFQNWHLSNTNTAIQQLEKSLSTLEKNGEYLYYVHNYLPLAMISWGLGNREKAFNIVYEGIRILEENDSISNKFWLYWSLGVFYFDMDDFSKSSEFYNKSLKLFEQAESGEIGDECFILIGLGTVCKSNNDLSKAMKYFKKVLEIGVRYNQWMQESRAYFEIASICKLEKKYPEALEYFRKSYEMRKQHNTKPGMISCLLECADISLLSESSPDGVIQILKEALELSIETKSKQKEFRCHHKLSKIYKSKNDYKSAFYHAEKFHELELELSGNQASNSLKKLETKFATESADKEAEIHKLINVDLRIAHNQLEVKNQEILDSIEYAKRIQLALFPSDELMKKHLPHSFVFYKPKDIVGGDFYWLESFSGRTYVAIADCTGHGVPGALLSVMCSTILTKVVKELGVTKPSSILDKSVELLQERFEKSNEDVQDGMDICLCCIDYTSQTLEYAGANNSIYRIKAGELNEIKADKQPIGKYDHRKPYTNHALEIDKGDQFFLFSDGFADQFGGEKGKKFKYKSFRDLLLSISHLKEDEQLSKLDETLRYWQKDYPQTDDICVLGLKV